ncbi:hypothetical protein SAMN04488074_108229 [Lentzea albidocapillata subsp. violacea]|uniref:Uncharacterized protein n=2 Tax=Lentzea albidocapillata TaxID=40571 RepID=A0A1G9GJ47_9PSEU|nr:hypothetical protein SAMN04488074_108229 [Lentzea albidocapillata subsp. violacea]
MRISRESRPGCACGLFHSVEAQQTWADRAAELTGYGAGVHGTMDERAKMLRAQIERDRRAVNLLRHIAQLDGNAVLVKLSTTAEDVMDLLTRDMAAYCREHNRFSVTMVGYAVCQTWTLTEFELARIESSLKVRKAVHQALKRMRDNRARNDG